MAAQQKGLIFQTSIGEVVKAWREMRGYTLTELAQRTNSTITKGYLSQLENNRIDQPNDDHLLRIAKALDIPVEYLLTRRMPHEVSHKEGRGFTFGSPLTSPRRGNLNEEEELRQILAQLDELRSRVKKLIAQKGGQH